MDTFDTDGIIPESTTSNTFKTGGPIGSAESAREYLRSLLTHIKLEEKRISSLLETKAKWESRIQLAGSSGDGALEEAARAEFSSVCASIEKAESELSAVRSEARTLARRLPVLKASERSVDTDYLEADLSLLLVKDLTREEASLDKKFAGLERSAAADSALSLLKEKMGIKPPPSDTKIETEPLGQSGPEAFSAAHEESGQSEPIGPDEGEH
jgi:phage shock protein A